MRRAGILLHPTSLPSHGPVGDLGPSAHQFVDWLAAAGCSLWQVLPLNPTGPGWCPYASPSALAAEPRLISVESLLADGLLQPHEVPASEVPRRGAHLDDAAVERWKRPLLEKAADRYAQDAPEALAAWVAGQAWAEDWALFAALSEEARGGWWSWEDRALANRDPDAMAAARARLAPQVTRQLALQALFDLQWGRLREHAESRGVNFIGDIPIFVSGDGCDTWAARELFRLDAEGKPEVVTGVPPDYFSKTGQLWGNPHYDWAAHAAQGFAWWRARLDRVLQHTHVVRIDHFRGLAAAWTIPADAETALEGHWEPGPGEALFRAAGELPIIAEDLGVITPDVHALRDAIDAPGMRILQFAFGDDADHYFLPHNYEHANCVVYTGTHDNDTAKGWYASTDEKVRHRYRVYAGRDGSDVAWDLIRLAWGSVADTAIAPMQDVLSLGAEARMNVPGEVDGNWTWRMPLPPDWAAPRLRQLAWAYGRLPPGAADD
ncbi:MAG: 4-alpha-glucanotransferase [Alphaproteobacteria bacterium]|nr:4-alpha-glucanotransferase [Alphaproteobacteria bacterium]MCB9791448.1 4-alpha-glucanotransferase [Alphaproteobacteria bacterium]